MAKLDAYTRNVYSKKLFQLQLTYDSLQAIFETCCSYMDFYESLQDRGIDRKTAKHFACQFGSMGLRNQGTEPYCNLPKSAVTGSEELNYSLDNVDLLLGKEVTERPPNVPPLPSVDDAKVCENTECWDDELDESRSFTFTIPKSVVPLSLTIDDFVSNSPSKQSKTSKQKRKNSNPSKQKNSQHQNSKPVDEIDNLGHENKLGDLTETKSTAKSNIKPNVSRKKPDPSDLFRNGASSLQIGKFPDKKERYQLEKDILHQIGKVYEENNLKKTSAEDIPETGEILVTESATPTTSEFLRNKGKSTGKETLEKDEMNNKKFPRKFVGKRKRNPGNNKNSYTHKQSNFVGSKKQIPSSSVTTKESSISHRDQPVADKEFKSLNGGKHASTPQDVLKKDLNEDKSMCNSESLKTSLEPKQASTSQSNYGFNNSVSVSQQQTAEINGMATKQGEPGDGRKDERNDKLSKGDKQAPKGSRVTPDRNKQYAVLQGEARTEITQEENISLQDTALLQGDKKIKKKPKVMQGGNFGQQETTISIRSKKDKKKKFKKVKQHRRPVVFVNRKSIEEKQKTWPRVEMFVGDFPIHVPVDPSVSVPQQQNNHTEEESGLNAESKEKLSSSTGNQGLRFGDSNSEHSYPSEKITQIQDSMDNKLRVSGEENNPCGEFGTKLGENEHVLHNSKSVINDEISVENSNRDETTLSQEQFDGKVDRNEGKDGIVTSELHRDLISEDNNVTSLAQSSPKLKCMQPATLSIGQFSDNQLTYTSHEIPVNKAVITAVKMTDSSQQTESDIGWYNGKELKKLVDQGQQTDCALLSTFNIETSLSLVHMQDKETLTDHSVSRRAQSTDTISSYGDNLSDLYGTSPSSPLYDTDSQYDINTEVFNRREYESPARVFVISMSPHHEDRYLKEDTHYQNNDTQYPEENTRHPETRYLEEDTWYPEDVNRYEIPSPEENYEYDGFHYTRKYQRIPRADFDRNSSSHSNVMPQRFPPCAPVPSPIYPANPHNISVPPLFHHRFPQQYFQRLPRNTSNVLPHQYHGPFKF